MWRELLNLNKAIAENAADKKQMQAAKKSSELIDAIERWKNDQAKSNKLRKDVRKQAG